MKVFILRMNLLSFYISIDVKAVSILTATFPVLFGTSLRQSNKALDIVGCFIGLVHLFFFNYRISRFHVGSIIVHYFWHFLFITGGAFNLFFVLSHGKCLNLGEQRRLEKRLTALNVFKILAKADKQAFPGVLGTCGGLGGFLEGPTASAWHRRRLAMGQSRLLSPSKAWRASRACTAW